MTRSASRIPADRRRGGDQRKAVLRHHVIEITESRQAGIDHIHLGAEPACHLCSLGADRSRADDQHRCRIHTRDAAEEDALSAVFHLQVLRALLDRHPARDLAHGDEQGKRSVRLLDRLIGNIDGLGCNHCLCQHLIRGQMEIGEDDLILADQLVLRRHRLLDMHHHVGAVIDFLRGLDDLRAGNRIGLIFEAASDPRVFFNEDRMTVVLHHLDAGRRHGDTVFLDLDLFQNPCNHVALLKCDWVMFRNLQEKRFTLFPAGGRRRNDPFCPSPAEPDFPGPPEQAFCSHRPRCTGPGASPPSRISSWRGAPASTADTGCPADF